ncbi:MAG: hypothetical protein Q8N04_03085 [Nitrospira sp.]|nr:hypothetical protein [Nitrospira sp.]
MWIESTKPLRVQFRGGMEIRLQPGAPKEFPDEDGKKLLKQAVGKVMAVDRPLRDEEGASPIAPLQPGWLVAYRDETYRLRGGCDERDHGTVQECQWNGTAWTIHLTDGQLLPLSRVLSVGKTNAAGEVIAAWTTRDCGYDGESHR